MEIINFLVSSVVRSKVLRCTQVANKIENARSQVSPANKYNLYFQLGAFVFGKTQRGKKRKETRTSDARSVEHTRHEHPTHDLLNRH